MVDLIADGAARGLPVTLGRASLVGFDPGPVTSIAPFPGRAVPGFPTPGQVVAQGAGRMVWAGRGMAFLIGAPAPDLQGQAAVTDQSDGWVWVTLSGADAVAVLARLVPLDLRPQAFPAGTTARSTLGHLPVLLIREAVDTFRIAAFRSMAGSLVHDLTGAMRAVAARR